MRLTSPNGCQRAEQSTLDRTNKGASMVLCTHWFCAFILLCFVARGWNRDSSSSSHHSHKRIETDSRLNQPRQDNKEDAWDLGLNTWFFTRYSTILARLSHSLLRWQWIFCGCTNAACCGFCWLWIFYSTTQVAALAESRQRRIIIQPLHKRYPVKTSRTNTPWWKH